MSSPENLTGYTKQILKVFLCITKEVAHCQVENYERRIFIAYQIPIDNTSQISYTSLYFREVNGKWVGAHFWLCFGADGIDFELKLGIQLEYIM